MEEKVTVGVSYFGVRDLRHVDEDLEEMAQAGLDTVVHTFSENDLAYYKGTLEEIVRLSEDRGLETFVDPWGVAGIFGGEAFSQFVVEELDARQVFVDGALAPAACPNHPKTRAFLESWVRHAADLGADGVFFDEPHFFKRDPTRWACRCSVCQDLFRQEYGEPMPDTRTPAVQEFQLHSLQRLIEHLAQTAHALHLKTSLCLLPREEELQHWETFARIPALDILGTDPYWVRLGLRETAVYAHVHRFAQHIKTLADQYQKEPQIWIQAFLIPAGTEEDVRQAVRGAVDAGVFNLMAWSFRATAAMSYIRPGRPEVVWQTLLEAFREAKHTGTP